MDWRRISTNTFMASAPPRNSAEPARSEEILIALIARLLEGTRHVATGVSSPVPACGALLARALSNGALRVSILGSPDRHAFSSSGVEMFDCAARGRLDAFFLGGGQIDGNANINLVGVGDYPDLKVRWGGSFGSALLYFAVPRVILFREEHTRRVFVPNVDFVSTPGVSDPNVWRRGGPCALVTSLCHFSFDKERRHFVLQSVHPGHTVEEVLDNTGFDFDRTAVVPETPLPDARTMALIRGKVAGEVAATYPLFASKVFGAAAA